MYFVIITLLINEREVYSSFVYSRINMNLQSIMKQAQSMQKDMLKIKNEIDATVFEGVSSLVTVIVNGKKEVLSIKISDEAKDLLDDLSMLSDMIVVAINDAFRKVDKMTEQKMSKYSNMMPGLM